MERYVKPKNINIIDLNKSYTGVEGVPDVDRCDIIVVTHLFGQDMDLSKLKKFKEKHNCLVIEDRVQGGYYDKKFSDDIVDISIYSMAMDKRPIAMGGGYMYIRNDHNKIIKDLIRLIDELPREKSRKRFNDLLKKIPTILLYNSRSFLFSFLSVLNLLSRFNKNINILNVSKGYRKGNPGFSRVGYMLKPSRGLLKSMYENFHKYEEVEEIYSKKYDYFIKQFPPKLVKTFFPWYKGHAYLTPYNTILINEHLVDDFLEFFRDNDMSSLPNPTYKLFNHSYKNEERYKKFNNGITYIPCTVNMSIDEITFLTNKIKEFYVKIQSKYEDK
jgi:dTDP-4-amino-4,6-dideoxygalactose transaminase